MKILIAILLLPMAAWSQRECGITCSKDGECIDWLTVCKYPQAPLGMAWMTTDDDWKLITFPDERLQPKPQQVTTMIELSHDLELDISKPVTISAIEWHAFPDLDPIDKCLQSFQLNEKTGRCEITFKMMVPVRDLWCTEPNASGTWSCSYIPKMLDTTPEEVDALIDPNYYYDPYWWDRGQAGPSYGGKTRSDEDEKIVTDLICSIYKHCPTSWGGPND
jgi:hypothetical protein